MILQEQTAIVTGASSGIGRAIALTLARNGANVVLAARSADKLEEVAREIRSTTQARALVVPTDVAQENDIRTMVHRATETFGQVDILVNNAGFGYFASVAELDMETVDRMMSVNLRGAMLCVQHVLSGMMERRHGSIINILSIAAKNGVKNGSAYAASKFALRGFAESLFMEVREYDIRVVNICPGSVATEFFDRAEQTHPNISKALRAEDIAETVLTALSLPQNANISELEIRPTNPR
jgi:NADP-dependent 3-hydroxy acid dehydrogenase YdfG